MSVYSDPTPRGRRFAVRGGEDREPSIRRWYSPNSNELYFQRRSRDQHRVDVLVADPATGEVRAVIEERLNTYVETQTPRRLENGDLIWWSERDGWGHLYRYGADGTEKGRLTEGSRRLSEKNLEIARAVGEVAQKSGRSPSQVAIAWLRQRPGVVIPMIGARTLA